MGNGGWTPREVAIVVPGPPPIVWADAINAGRKVGAAKHWALYFDEVRMLILRSTIPVRTTDNQAGESASKRAIDWWHKRLMFATLNPDFSHPVWTWDTTSAGDDR